MKLKNLPLLCLSFASFASISLIKPHVIAAKDIFVSTSGNDSSAGTQSAPYRTFSKANSVAVGGDNIFVAAGTYTQRLQINKNGSASARITVQPVAGQKVIIDGQNNSANLIDVPGRYVSISGFEVKGSNAYCVNLTGQNIEFKNNFVHECSGHGIYTDGQSVLIDGNEVTRTNLSYSSRTAESGWGSAMKVRVGGDNITFQNNLVYENYGEGVAVTRGTNSTVRNNTFYNNFAVNIYIDNSHDVVVDRNFVYCTNNSGFEFNDSDRRGQKPNGIAMGEEQYDGWGAQLANIRFTNNIVSNCQSGIRYWSADVSGGGLKNIFIAHNTFYQNDRDISLSYEPTKQQGTVVTSNLVSGISTSTLGRIENKTGIEMSNNYWSPGLPTDVNSRGTNDVIGGNPFAVTPAISNPATFRLASNSTAIGAAKAGIGVTSDFEGKNRTGSGNSTTDIGAIEFSGSTGPLPTNTPVVPTATRIPSLTPTRTPTRVPTQTPITTKAPTVTIGQGCREDINRDNFVDIMDYSILANDFLKSNPSNPNSDINQDGIVDLSDYSRMVNRFFDTCN
jgi:parallel beta-helix repeat protein